MELIKKQIHTSEVYMKLPLSQVWCRRQTAFQNVARFLRKRDRTVTVVLQISDLENRIYHPLK